MSKHAIRMYCLYHFRNKFHFANSYFWVRVQIKCHLFCEAFPYSPGLVMFGSVASGPSLCVYSCQQYWNICLCEGPHWNICLCEGPLLDELWILASGVYTEQVHKRCLQNEGIFLKKVWFIKKIGSVNSGTYYHSFPKK